MRTLEPQLTTTAITQQASIKPSIKAHPAIHDQALWAADSVVPRSSASRVVRLAKLIAPAIVIEIG